MRPPKHKKNNHQDLFRQRLDNIINMRHELVLLSHGVDWDRLDIHFGLFFSENGRPGIPSRIMIGLHILKHTFALSDEEVCDRWVENPYFQYFCGETFFQHDFDLATIWLIFTHKFWKEYNIKDLNFMEEVIINWALEEIGRVNLGDKRLEARAITLLNNLGSKPLETIPVACQGWAETKAAYRFFDNDKVTAAKVFLNAQKICPPFAHKN